MITTTATNKKVREIIDNVRRETLIPRPEFQRRLVWTSRDKDRFIETVIRGFPFPEIYLCDGEVDTDTGHGTQLLVDGLQRVNTLYEYFSGATTFVPNLTKPYKNLDREEKERFLEYNVVVRDLGKLSNEKIIDVFQRLNSTQYTLKDMEINNAVYAGELKQFCERISLNQFFEDHRVFTAADRRRMGDVSYCLSIVGTMMNGYFNRDSDHEALLSAFNENFPDSRIIEERIDRVFFHLDECGFDNSSRIWKKADFFTAFIEIDYAYSHDRIDLEPTDTLNRLSSFYEMINVDGNHDTDIAAIYYKSALQASNDKLNRVRRGLVVSGILRGKSGSTITRELEELSLI
mgnify:CR=1 FL=1|tara:strand:+ start:207 stop:1247 length:1041 start_codon:yes stop_codon:yes gene_type:complete